MFLFESSRMTYNLIKRKYIMKTQQEIKDLDMVKKNGLKLKHVENQTEEICLEAVKQNGLAL